MVTIIPRYDPIQPHIGASVVLSMFNPVRNHKGLCDKIDYRECSNLRVARNSSEMGRFDYCKGTHLKIDGKVRRRTNSYR